MNKLNLKGLALALGITWGIAMLFLGWVGGLGWGMDAVNVMGSFYIGFDASFIGGIIGAIWGFFDGAIGGIVIAWLYNYFSAKEKKAVKK